MAAWLIPENGMSSILKCLTSNGNENRIFGGKMAVFSIYHM